MPRKLRKAPQFLKEIPLGGGSEGDNASEWNYAESPSGSRREDYNRAQNNFYANYLGWWGGNGRAVYYFGDHNREWRYENEWSKYDWYLQEARRINSAIDRYNEQVDEFNRGKFNTDVSPYFNKIILLPPKEPHNTLGIQRWLQAKVAEYDAATKNFITEVDARHAAFKKLVEQKRQAEEKEEQERQKAFEEMIARRRAERERQAKIKQQQEELRQKRDDAVVQTFDKRINLLEKAVDELGKQKLDFDQYTVSNMTELDGIRRDLREIDAQSVQKQEKTDKEVSRLGSEIGELRGESVKVDNLNKTVQINTKTLSKLDEKYDLLKKKLNNEVYNSSVGLSRVHDKISKVEEDIRKDLTAIQEENKKINKDYIDGVSVFKEKQENLIEEVGRLSRNEIAERKITRDWHARIDSRIERNKEKSNEQFKKLQRGLIEVKKEMGTRVKYDVHSNDAAKRRTGTIPETRVRARQYDAARDILKSYLSTIFAQYTTV